MNKLSIVLVALVITFSLMFSVAAYFSSNPTAYVKAEVLLDVDFGTMFPGMEMTESFTIDSLDSSDYTITLIEPTDPDVLDIRPYLIVWKDPAEHEDDGPVSGDPDYTGNGSFTIPGDSSDKWFVSFTVPDVPDITLPEDINLDYGCKIAIEPVIAPPLVPEGDLVLRPDADGDLTQFDLPAEGSHYVMVDDIGTHDNGTTYVDNTTDNRIDLYDLEDSGLIVGTDVYQVTLIAAMKGDGVDRTNGFYGLKSGTNEYWGTKKSSLPTGYSYFSRVYVNDPATGLPWTVAAIDALQVGFFIDDAANSGLTATQIYVVVDTTP